MSGANGGGGLGCLDIHCGEWEQPNRELTVEVVASVHELVVSRVISGKESKVFVDNKDVLEELVMKIELFSLAETESDLVEVVDELE